MKVLLSSTCYDLADLRDATHSALSDLGHEAILSDRSDFKVDARQHRHDICVEAAAQADIVLIVIDAMFGAPCDKDASISTWAEFRAAAKAGVPVATYVRDSVKTLGVRAASSSHAQG